MRRILVTGSTGRLGLNLVQALRAKTYEVVGFAFNSPAEKELRKKLKRLGAQVVLGNLATGEGVEKAVRDVDGVIHAAALMQEDRAPSRQTFFDINTRGTFQLLEAIRARGKAIKRTVAVTTGAVYDVFTAQPPIREDADLNPLALYGMCKILNEEMYRLFTYQHGLPIVTLRPNLILAGTEPIDLWRGAHVIGALKRGAGDPRTVLYTKVKQPWKLVEKAIDSPQDLVIPYGPGGKPWCWHGVDVRDVVQGCIRALETKNSKAIGGIFNVVSAQPQPFDRTVKYLARKLGGAYKEVHLPVMWDIRIDVRKAKRVLGYKPQYDIKRMIDDALAFKAGQDTGVIPPGIPH
ncbi:MAG: NAD(P)-dependent oxidoreductase [Kiritimatiellae bacterium]|nr:NAD(P)-dependent oxidoreductase [Kiritimatiellia bacterium]